MPESFIATQTLTSLLALPIQENFCASKASPLPISSGSNGNAAADRAERRSVMRRHAIEEIGKTEAAGAFHVFRNQRWIARNMMAHIAADRRGHRDRMRRRSSSRYRGPLPGSCRSPRCCRRARRRPVRQRQPERLWPREASGACCCAVFFDFSPWSRRFLPCVYYWRLRARSAIIATLASFCPAAKGS